MFDGLIEQKIQEAIRRGEFDALEGAGQPLHFDDEDVPPESRMAYKILKNAGIVPEEMQIRKDIMSLEQLIDDLPAGEGDKRLQLMSRLNENWARYHAAMDKRRRS